MAKLSNIVGGLMRDLAQSHSISDAFSMETLDTYRRDSMLAQLPVPRMAIREVQLTLRFAVTEVQDPVVEPDPQEFRELWLKTLRERVVPQALTDVGRIDNKRLVAAFEKRLASSAASASVDPDAITGEGREDELVKATQVFLRSQVESLPASSRRSLEATDLVATFDRIARVEMQELRRAARQIEQTRLAAKSELDVVVTANDLAGVPQNQISELTLTVTMDELHLGGTPGADGKEV